MYNGVNDENNQGAFNDENSLYHYSYSKDREPQPGQPDQKGLDDLTPAQAKVYMDENQFAKGSMLPKVQAAVKFAESKAGRTALITLLEKAKDGIEGKTGTRVHQ